MRPQLTLVLLSATVLAGCGSTPPSAESVVRAWSQELNTGDNNDAAKLFAPGAEIVQAGTTLRLNTEAQAVAWNAALPCSGRIVSITTSGNLTRATFILGDRPDHKCDGPGQKATAIFRVRKGKIVLWHQTSTAPLAPVGPAV
jgi:limonene-1,2-epoxide hydrolase